MSYQTILFETRGPVGLLTLNRPDRLNAISQQMIDEVNDLLDRIETGSGALHFDFSGVAYLDSSGVGAIVKIVQAARRVGSKVRFSGIRGSPRRVLELSNILPLLVETDA